MIDPLWLTLCSYFANALWFQTLLIQLNGTWSFLWLFAIFFCRIEKIGNSCFSRNLHFLSFSTIYSLLCFPFKRRAYEFFPEDTREGPEYCLQHWTQLESCTVCPPIVARNVTCNWCRSRISSYFCNITRNCFTVCPSSATLRATSWLNVACNDASCVRAFRTLEDL